jgi:hypothetical protein
MESRITSQIKAIFCITAVSELELRAISCLSMISSQDVSLDLHSATTSAALVIEIRSLPETPGRSGIKNIFSEGRMPVTKPPPVERYLCSRTIFPIPSVRIKSSVFG